jgi:hypothetical protein
MFASKPAGTPARRGKLAQPVHAYVGTYRDDNWGTVQILAAADSFAAQFGTMTLPVRMLRTDQFVADDYQGRFDVDSVGSVRAVWFHMSKTDSVRFERVAAKKPVK